MFSFNFVNKVNVQTYMSNQKRRIRSRTFSDSGLQKPKSILKKTSAYAPRVSKVFEARESSTESLFSVEQQQEEKRQKMLSNEQESIRTDSSTPTAGHKDRRGNFIVRAIWSTKKKFKFSLIKRWRFAECGSDVDIRYDSVECLEKLPPDLFIY